MLEIDGGKGCIYRLVEDRGENEQKHRVHKVNGRNGNVEGIGLSVHPWPEKACGYQRGRLDDQQANGLNKRRFLRQADKGTFSE